MDSMITARLAREVAIVSIVEDDFGNSSFRIMVAILSSLIGTNVSGDRPFVGLFVGTGLGQLGLTVRVLMGSPRDDTDEWDAIFS